jgi:lipoprotein-releasing system permease protein
MLNFQLIRLFSRYLISKKKKNLINILSYISLGGVAIGTMAMVMVLSAFNGLEDLVRGLYGTFDPDLKIEVNEGKWFETQPELLFKLQNLTGVKQVVEVVEDNALLRYKNGQLVVRLKGVSKGYEKLTKMKDGIMAGKFELESGGEQMAVVGLGIQIALNLALNDHLDLAEIWYPKAGKKVNLNPQTAFAKKALKASGVFQIEKNYDENYVFVPIELMEELLNNAGKRSSLEIYLKPGASVEKLKKEVKLAIGSNYKVLSSEEQHANLYRILRIEKLFVFLALSFIVLIASFNIYVSISMLALEKKREMAILFALGAEKQTIAAIFLSNGMLIGLSGAFLGLSLGALITWSQHQFGWLGMGMETSIVDAYPVKMLWTDFASIGLLVLGITLLATVRPSLKAAHESFSKQGTK